MAGETEVVKDQENPSGIPKAVFVVSCRNCINSSRPTDTFYHKIFWVNTFFVVLKPIDLPAEDFTCHVWAHVMAELYLCVDLKP